MKKHQRLLVLSVISVLFIIVLVTILNPILNINPSVRGKSPAVPVPDGLTEAQALAQDLALSDPEVQALTAGKRSEVFGVRMVWNHFTPDSSACADFECYQVEIYNFDQDEAVTAIVDVENRAVLDVLYQPGVHPGINKRLVDLALEIATTHPDVLNELGFQPEQADMAPVDAFMVNTACDEGHLCVAPTFNMGTRILWAVVDLTDEKLAGINFTGRTDKPEQFVESVPEGCPSPGSVDRDGWQLSYETTGTDGLRVYNVTFNGVPVATSIKLVEWHADYGASGFDDSTGCGGGGGGFPIYSYGDTQIQDLFDTEGDTPIGFEVVQDFRMGNWGATCNYRYEQHVQFFTDGSYKVVGGAYGKGCGPNALYRPLTRIDVAVAGDADDSFSRWDGADWQLMITEDYLVPYTETGHGPHAFDAEGYSWLVEDISGTGYKVKLSSEGAPDDGFQDDDPFLYIVRHHPNEGDSDLGVIGNCSNSCPNNHHQGPEIYLNGESIDGENIVMWYVPQHVTNNSPGNYYCWTVHGEPSDPNDPPVETYPCFGGPRFDPTVTSSITAGFQHSGPAVIGETVYFTDTTTGIPPFTYLWDFGDGSGSSTVQNPTYSYSSDGVFTPTLTVSNTQGIDVYTDTLFIGVAALSGFTHSGAVSVGETAYFTNTSAGTPPLFYVWTFGDSPATSTLENPTHIYNSQGFFTATLTTTNSFNSNQSLSAIAVGVPPVAKFGFQAPVFPGSWVDFVNQTLGAKSYTWDFGDGSPLSYEEYPTHLFDNTGTYTVTLSVSNQFGNDDYELLVEVSDPRWIFIPTALRTDQ